MKVLGEVSGINRPEKKKGSPDAHVNKGPFPRMPSDSVAMATKFKYFFLLIKIFLMTTTSVLSQFDVVPVDYGPFLHKSQTAKIRRCLGSSLASGNGKLM